MMSGMGVIFRRVQSEEKEDLTDFYNTLGSSRNYEEIVDNCRKNLAEALFLEKCNFLI
jgi:hypothetical protein